MAIAVEQACDTSGTLSFPLGSWGVIDNKAGADVTEAVDSGDWES